MRAIFSVIGRDRRGIIAKVSGCLYEFNVNIEDISQTVMGDNFTMVMMVDLAESAADIAAVNGALQRVAAELCVEIRMQNEEIFNSMHKI
jgi:ACT domain-containing protein